MKASIRFPLSLAATLAGMACQGGAGPNNAHFGTVEVLDSSGLQDSVDAPLIRQLTLSVRDQSGRPLHGAAVRIRVPYYADPQGRFGGFPALPHYDDSTGIGEVTGVVNDTGLVRFTLLRGHWAGTFPLIAEVDQIGYSDTLDLIIQPGQATSLQVIPADTALYPGATLQLRAATLDRYDNPRADTVTYLGSGGLVQVSPSGLVTAGPTVGRDSVTVEFSLGGTLTRAKGHLSVVPPGTLAVVYRGIGGTQIGTLATDGSGLRLLSPVDPTFQFRNDLTWDSAGARIFFVDSGGLFQITTGSTPVRSAIGLAAPGFGVPIEGEMSRDGKVLLTTQVAAVVGGLHVFVHDPDGTHPRVVTPRIGLGLTYTLAWRPSPSPDGALAAIITDELNGGLRVISISTGQPQPWLTSGQRPRWSPVGDLIGFTSQGNGPLKVIHPDGTAERVVSLPGIAYAESQLGWSGDGQWLIGRAADSVFHLVHVQTGLTLPLGFTGRVTDAAIRP